MKFFVAFAALAAVAVASPLLKPTISETEQLEAIIAAIQSPSTDPATAALLEDMLAGLLGVEKPIVGPAIIDNIDQQTPIVGPALVDFPVNEGPIPEGSIPLVQIIVNVRNSASFVDAGAAAISPPQQPDSVIVVDSALEVADDVLVSDLAPEAVDDVLVSDGPASGVIVADLDAPQVLPVAVATPDIPSLVANLPDQLN